MKTRDQVYDFIEGIKSRLRIDENNLVRECSLQPLLYEEISSLAALARSEANRKKEDVETFRAKLNIAIRDNPEKYVSGKVTEGAISNTIESNEELIVAKNEYLDALEISGALDSMLRTVEQRKSMLRDLVQLFVFQYYSSENTRAPSSQEVRKADEEAVANAREVGRRRRRSGTEIEEEED